MSKRTSPPTWRKSRRGPTIWVRRNSKPEKGRCWGVVRRPFPNKAFGSLLLLGQQLPQDVLQNATVLVVQDFLGRVDPNQGRELPGGPVLPGGADPDQPALRKPTSNPLGQPLD